MDMCVPRCLYSWTMRKLWMVPPAPCTWRAVTYAATTALSFTIAKCSSGIFISTDKKNLEVSGAMAQLLLYKNNKLTTIKGDRISIGYDQMERGFSSHTFPLSKGDKLYMFTDGIIDQFGGEENQKLKIHRLKELIEKVANDPFNKQEKEINNYLKNWQGDNPSLDDSLLIGLEY